MIDSVSLMVKLLGEKSRSTVSDVLCLRGQVKVTGGALTGMHERN